MIEVKGNIFNIALAEDAPVNIMLVTTNGCWNSRDGKAIMGAGFARAVREQFPKVSENLGLFLSLNHKRFKDTPRASVIEPWNIPYKLGKQGNCHLFSFPTKPTQVTITKESVLPKYYDFKIHGMTTEGWKGYSQLSLIERSAEYIAELMNSSFIERVYTVRPGCSNGGLEWAQVKPVLDKYFDSRYTIVERE